MYYSSPRWTQEILDCSMPMTFDTYSVCSYGCLYCFSFFQKSHCVVGYLDKKVRSVNPKKIVNMFNAILSGKFERLDSTEIQFIPYIGKRKVMQWGALADQFDNFEKKYNVTLKLLKYFDTIDYPLSFSTKATWWTEDKRYMELFEKHKHNWHVKMSIISLSDKCKEVEKGVPTPEERLKALKRLNDIGIPTTLRLRPYIIGLSEDYKELIYEASKTGVQGVTTEFMCLETRADENLKERYKKFSNVLGFDVYKLYRERSGGVGYLRFDVEYKRDVFKAMRDYAHSLNLRFNVSDAAGRDFNDTCNCCGVPKEWNSQTSHFGGAVLIAKERGEVHFRDIEKDLKELFDGFEWVKAAAYNTGGNRNRAKFYDATMFDWIKGVWNGNGAKAPDKMYSCLKRGTRDEDGNYIYKYVGEKNV